VTGPSLALDTSYYADKLPALRDLFGTEDLRLDPGAVVAGGRRYPVVGDVIILSASGESPPSVHRALAGGSERSLRSDLSGDIQFTFGEEWKQYPRLLPEHGREFDSYFDLVDRAGLRGARVCDLGCGIGRWSHFVKDDCRELVLVDFSDAIFVARENLRDCPHALFFMGDLRTLPFRRDFADFLFCLGVLHHLPVPCLDEVRAIARYAPRLLIFLYYSLDNRPFYYRFALQAVTFARTILCRIRWAWFRRFFSWLGALFIYKPLVVLGRLLNVFGWGRYVPLFEFYQDKSLRRIEQDVYDRFFTSIEQRVSRKEILALTDVFSRVTVSDHLPYWHFLCER
jgi:SAM-dependent methyltransferase